MKGRIFKIFLPILTGLFLTVAILGVVRSDVEATSSCWHWHGFFWHNHCPSPTPSPSPSPSPSPEPSPSPSPEPSTPPVGGPGPEVGGEITTPQCPTDRPQKVDQVWFSDVKPNEVTVHWANKGDAWGFQIQYGPAQDQLIWGVEVSDKDASQYTLKDLPGGDLWVVVIAKSSKECGGSSSDTVQVAGVTPQVLGATGVATKTATALAGFSLIGLGLWQVQRVLQRADKKSKKS